MRLRLDESLDPRLLIRKAFENLGPTKMKEGSHIQNLESDRPCCLFLVSAATLSSPSSLVSLPYRHCLIQFTFLACFLCLPKGLEYWNLQRVSAGRSLFVQAVLCRYAPPVQRTDNIVVYWAVFVGAYDVSNTNNAVDKDARHWKSNLLFGSIYPMDIPSMPCLSLRPDNNRRKFPYHSQAPNETIT
jgi:hypothetical protein